MRLKQHKTERLIPLEIALHSNRYFQLHFLPACIDFSILPSLHLLFTWASQLYKDQSLFSAF